MVITVCLQCVKLRQLKLDKKGCKQLKGGKANENYNECDVIKGIRSTISGIEGCKNSRLVGKLNHRG